jgi:hypothetical protein
LDKTQVADIFAAAKSRIAAAGGEVRMRMPLPLTGIINEFQGPQIRLLHAVSQLPSAS